MRRLAVPPRSWGLILVVAGVVCVPSWGARAESPRPGDGGRVPLRDLFSFFDGPAMASLGARAQVELGSVHTFLGGAETRRLVRFYGGTPSGRELGSVMRAEAPDGWFVVFEFDPLGHVRDEERDRLDAALILAALRQRGELASDERREQGLPALEMIGWRMPPRYDAVTHDLQWCVLWESGGHPIVNHDIRILGRRGVMAVTLVCDPIEFDEALEWTQILLRGFSYKPGERYEDFSAGDPVARHGLAGLAAGGGLAPAGKPVGMRKLLEPALLGLLLVGGAVAKRYRSPSGIPR